MTHAIFAQLALGSGLAIAHFFGEEASERLEKYHSEMISLSAGIFVTILFMDLLPLAVTDNLNFTLILLGFIIFHSMEKTVYQRHPKQFKSRKDLSVAGFFFVNFLNGLVITLIYEVNPQLAILVMVPLIIGELASSAMLSHLISKMKEKNTYKLILSGSVFLGAIAGSFLNPDSALANNILAFIIGALFYLVIRDMLPQNKEGRLDYFLIGVFGMYLALFMFR